MGMSVLPVVIWQQQRFVGTAGLRVPQPCSPQWCVTPRGGGPAGCWRAWHGLRGRHCYVTSSRAGGGRRRRKHSWASGLFQPGCSWGLPVARGCGCWMGSPWGWTPSHALGCWGWAWGNGKGWQVPDISGAAGRDGDSLMSNKGCAPLPPLLLSLLPCPFQELDVPRALIHRCRCPGGTRSCPGKGQAERQLWKICSEPARKPQPGWEHLFPIRMEDAPC